MTAMPLKRRAIFGAVLMLACFTALALPDAAEPLPVTELTRQTHAHGLAVDRADPSRLYLATHHGLYAVRLDGTAMLLSNERNDYMGFTPHPSDAATLYASGHPAGGGNMGVLVSKDGGRSWRQIAAGVNGPVDFHQMDVSSANPQVLYGTHAGSLQVSRDSGSTWNVVGPAPRGLIDLAASAKDANVLYAATEGGLLKSEDGGKSWHEAYLVRRPATMVQVTPEEEVYAFLVGTGLVRTSEPSLSWRTLGDGIDGGYFLHLAAAPGGESLYAVGVTRQDHEVLLVSRDGGRSWSALQGS